MSKHNCLEKPNINVEKKSTVTVSSGTTLRLTRTQNDADATVSVEFFSMLIVE
jgi:hypothetical protein